MAARIEDGNTKHPLYKVWEAMKRRCASPRDAGYPHYGGRGIFVCEAWRSDFRQFARDMGPRPEGYAIDRINNDGPYAPENCRWVPQAANNANRRRGTPAQTRHLQRMRAVAKARFDADRATKTAFRCGHPFTDDNSYRFGTKRWCRTCAKARANRGPVTTLG